MNSKGVWLVILMALLATYAHGQQSCTTVRDFFDEYGVFKVQVGAFRSPSHAQGYFTRLDSAGFNPVLERYGGLDRVVVPVRAIEEVEVVVQRLETAGFRNVWLRGEGTAIRAPGGQGTYRVQVGAFRSPSHAQASITRLRTAGFDPASKVFHSPRHGAVTRVFIPGVRASERSGVVQRLRHAGFEGTWIRCGQC